jgi:hypothetical protein
MNHELEKKLTEVVVDYFKVLPRHSNGGTEESTENLSDRIAGIPAEIQIGHLPKTTDKRYRYARIHRQHDVRICFVSM